MEPRKGRDRRQSRGAAPPHYSGSAWRRSSIHSLVGDSQLLELRGDVGGGVRGDHLLVDGPDDPLLVNVEGPPLGNGASFMDDAVGPGHALVGIAEDRVV